MLSKTYNPHEFESKIYKEWEQKGYFTPEIDSKKTPFTIVIPPPNITGQLHMGHALNNSIQDAIIRFKRMQGYSALYLPGTDHASIATEVKIVEQLEKEGLSKKLLGRERFLERAWEWKEKYGGRIIEQLKSLGCSCDWTRLAFTMDERCSRAVRHVFVKLYEKGLIYRGDRIINWCPSCKTALSDAEVDYEEQDSYFWHIKYPFKDGSGYVTVATTRPETMLGDTAVAVNPKDARYKGLVGKTLILPLMDREIPLIADDYVDIEFGTGAVKITPAHDPNDFEVGMRHGLPVVRVMNDDGSMSERAGRYASLDRFEARKKVVGDLKALGLLGKMEPHRHNVGQCYRCESTVEPIVSKQWFVKMAPLAEPAIKVVKEGKIRFIPKRFEKIYFNWMENIKDWCISRQLWWGHRIPAFYCDNCGHTAVSMEDLKACPECGSANVRQDENVLDTWFSSALWPFSTMGYPDRTEDLEYFHPTDVLVTAYDIIFFWVARMIFSALEHMGEIPFKEVLITGLVRDALGRKMSKSLGNGIDPMEVIEKYGADTLRFSLLNGVAPGSDMRFSQEKLEGCRNFGNKLWNAARFVLINAEGRKLSTIESVQLNIADKWVLTRLNQLIKEATANLEKYELGLAGSKIYDFVWSVFCDWYIELAKPLLYGDDEEKRDSTLVVLLHVLGSVLKLLHPFIPFITETIWQSMPGASGSIMVQKFPEYDERFVFEEEAEQMGHVIEAIRSIRNLRAEMNVPPSRRTGITLVPLLDGGAFESCLVYVEKLAFGTGVRIAKREEVSGNNVSIVLPHCEIYIAALELIDKEKEIERLSKELEEARGELERAQGKLANQGFIAKAPAHLVEQERQKREKYSKLVEQLTQKLEELKKM
ncbi:MAG: valine--tRNA ligase [Clostridiales bacterium]|nr:valine--tRNA ligase [Clostridiales bacterium]